MKLKTSSIVIAVTILLFLFLAGRYGFTVVSIEEVENTVQSEAFDPVAYVDGIWESDMMPTFKNEAVELSTILSEIEVGADGLVSKESLIPITQKHGLITVGEAHMYMVRGSGSITNADTETSLGTIEVALDDYSGPIKVHMYVGTRIPNDETSLRDAVGFITLNDFRDQMEYGKVSLEMNKRVLSQVLGDLDTSNLTGKTISFVGAFNIRTFNLIQIEVTEIYIVPVEFELGE
jgi:predicted lipoprotein